MDCLQGGSWFYMQHYSKSLIDNYPIHGKNCGILFVVNNCILEMVFFFNTIKEAARFSKKNLGLP